MKKATITARQLLERKATGVVAVAPTDGLMAVLRLLADRNIGAVVVLDGGALVGILSERDIVRKVELVGRTVQGTVARDIMTATVFTVGPTDSVDDCRRVMNDRRIRHLPVVAERAVIGMLSSRDVLEELIAEEEHLIRDLETERLMTTTGSY